jgi:putative ABC transport system permease protein
LSSLAIRNLGARKLRSFLTALAIVLGVMMVAGTYVLTDTIEQSFDRIFAETNAGIDAVVTSKEAVETDDGQEPPIDETVLDRVREVDGVAVADGGIGDPRSPSSTRKASGSAAGARRPSRSRPARRRNQRRGSTR